jgi:hypothetical protein
VVTTNPVESFIASTVTPGSGELSAARTVPETRLVVTSVCASVGKASAKVRMAIQKGSARVRANRGLHIELLLNSNVNGRAGFFGTVGVFEANLHEVSAWRE